MALDLSKWKAVKGGLARAIDDGVEQTAEHVGDLAQQLAPEDTGDLKASRLVYPGPTEGSWVVSFGDGLPDPRAIVQEYGSLDQPAQPYLGPAIKEIDLTLEVKKNLQELIEK